MKNKKLTQFDKIIVFAITFLYAIVSFVSLGSTALPQSRPEADDGDIRRYKNIAAFEEEASVDRLMFFKGLGEGAVLVYRSDNGETWEKIAEKETGDCFAWDSIKLDTRAKYLKISAAGDKTFEIFEIGFIEKESGKIIKPEKYTCRELFDEQETVAKYATYENSTYFDEIYHARTAYEHFKGIYPYEISHPLLGKLIISVGIRIFGMNTFGWRIMGNVFGIMMLPLMYVFAKRIFKNSFAATAAMLLMCFDFMHFAQTRIATIDSFSVFFIMLMYYLMYIYFDSSTQELSHKKALGILAACGTVFGMGIATKWICVYAGVGLAVLFAAATVRRAKEGEAWLKTCMWCVIFFLVIPLAIYFASYYPYYAADGTRSTIQIFWDNQVYMLTYHGKLTATHPFQSRWYTWPAIIKPIWYYGAEEGMPQGMVSSIVSMGNPAVWWLGGIAAVLLIFKPRKNRNIWFLTISFLSQFLPWVFINRPLFIYHYFASVPFIILALSYILLIIKEHFKYGYAAGAAVLTAAAVLFIMFYPVLSGNVVSREYVQNCLQWFETWTLCY